MVAFLFPFFLPLEEKKRRRKGQEKERKKNEVKGERSMVNGLPRLSPESYGLRVLSSRAMIVCLSK